MFARRLVGSSLFRQRSLWRYQKVSFCTPNTGNEKITSKNEENLKKQENFEDKQTVNPMVVF